MISGGALGGFLRARRARLQPRDVGLPAGIGIRRTPGLRREELATLAGVSFDYYTRLEQGKETNPSSAVLDALAAALALDDDAYDHLYALARHAPRRSAPARRPEVAAVRPGLRLLVENLRPNPAYVLSSISDVLAINLEGLALFEGLAEWPEFRRNTIRFTFLHPMAPRLLIDWDHAAAAAVGNLRAAEAGDPASPELAALVDELTTASTAFATLWQRYDVRPRRSDVKSFHHSTVGDLTLHHEVLRVEHGQRLTVYLAPDGTADHDALKLLSMSSRGAGSDDRRRP